MLSPPDTAKATVQDTRWNWVHAPINHTHPSAAALPGFERALRAGYKAVVEAGDWLFILIFWTMGQLTTSLSRMLTRIAEAPMLRNPTMAFVALASD